MMRNRLLRVVSHRYTVFVIIILVIGLYLSLSNVLPQKSPIYLTGCNDKNNKEVQKSTLQTITNAPCSTLPNIQYPKHRFVNVIVNYLKQFQGLLLNNELYVPFDFLRKYYEIYGEFQDNEKESFLWLHTSPYFLDVKNLPFTQYSNGSYLNFHTANVPNRARVKCICGRFEVPITMQWNPKGYYYPTQIAQYGLSYISKFYVEGQPEENFPLDLISGETGVKRFTELNTNLETPVLKVKFSDQRTSFTVKLLASNRQDYTIKYVTDDTSLENIGNTTFVYGIGKTLFKKEITRDLYFDLNKGLSYIPGKTIGKSVELAIKKILSITVSKIEYVESIVLVEEDHIAKFVAAADWFLYHQDALGGWKVNVSRNIIRGMRSKPGWYSAMGQGQAISLLCRVYRYTKNEKYLNAALQATKVFNILSTNNGVLVMLFDKYPWYEEYPTKPPSCVLNGFIYSLFGLYDLMLAAPSNNEAKRLFNNGINTLKAVLPLFDNGHGSFYDLRHVSIPGHQPNRARWQYHRVHLEQLYSLVELTGSQIINNTLNRWIGYASGVPSRHN